MTAVSRWLLGRLERLLAALVGAEVAEAVLGDALEAGSDPGSPEAGPPIRELFGSLPPLIAARVGGLIRQREVDRSMDKWPKSMRRAAAVLGALACLPALLLVTGGILQMLFGSPAMLRWLEQTLHNEQIPLVHFLRQPAVILGGLLLAGALNLLPLIRFGLSRQDGSMVGTVSVRTRATHLAIGSLSAVLLAVLLAYGFTENYTVTPRRELVPVVAREGYLLERAVASSAERFLVPVVTDPCLTWRRVIRLDSESLSADIAPAGCRLP